MRAMTTSDSPPGNVGGYGYVRLTLFDPGSKGLGFTWLGHFDDVHSHSTVHTDSSIADTQTHCGHPWCAGFDALILVFATGDNFEPGDAVRTAVFADFLESGFARCFGSASNRPLEFIEALRLGSQR